VCSVRRSNGYHGSKFVRRGDCEAEEVRGSGCSFGCPRGGMNRQPHREC
jgi:hypothetical protein